MKSAAGGRGEAYTPRRASVASRRHPSKRVRQPRRVVEPFRHPLGNVAAQDAPGRHPHLRGEVRSYVPGWIAKQAIQITIGIGESKMYKVNKAKVYRTISSDAYGWYVWEICGTMGRDGEPMDAASDDGKWLMQSAYGVEDRHGDAWYVSCGHYWSEEHARAALLGSESISDGFIDLELIHYSNPYVRTSE